MTGKPGISTVEVACDNKIISHPVSFTFKLSPKQSTVPQLPHTDKEHVSQDQYWRNILIHKLEALNICSIQDKNFFLQHPVELTVRSLN